MKHEAVQRCQVEGGVQENLRAPHLRTLSVHTHTSREQGGKSTHNLAGGASSVVGS